MKRDSDKLSQFTSRSWLKKAGMAAGVAALTLSASIAQAADTIKVGVLHSLSGTMEIGRASCRERV